MAALYEWPRRGPRYLQALYICYLTSVALILTRHSMVIKIGVALFAASLLLTLAYAILHPKLTRIGRAMLIWMSLLTFLAFGFAQMHYPGAGILGLICISNLVCYVFIRWKRSAEFRSEMGILALILAESLIRSILSISHLF